LLKEESEDNIINVVTRLWAGLYRVRIPSREKRLLERRNLNLVTAKFEKSFFLPLKPKNSPDAKSASL
jgi:hypothetical protein